MNISNFISWFIQQFVNIGSTLLGFLDNIILFGNVSLMNFIITIAIIGMFLGLIITTPTLNIVKRSIRKEKRNDNSK